MRLAALSVPCTAPGSIQFGSFRPSAKQGAPNSLYKPRRATHTTDPSNRLTQLPPNKLRISSWCETLSDDGDGFQCKLRLGVRAAGGYASAGALLRGQDQRRAGGDVGRRARQRLARRPGPGAVAGPHLRLRVPVQGHVPLRARRHADQARRKQLRRHRHHLLPHVGGAVGGARRGRPRVPGQRHRRAVHAAHQRLRQRHRRQRAAVPPLVRPDRRIPHLLHRVDAAAHHCACGRNADPGVQEPRGPGRAVPVVAADAPLRQPVGRRGLGHAGRPRQDGLVARAVRRAVPQLHRRRRRRFAVRVRQRVRAGDGRDGAAGHEVGAGKVYGVRLLRGRQEVPGRLPARVLHGVVPKPGAGAL